MRYLTLFVILIAPVAAGEKKVDPVRRPALIDLQNDVCPIAGKKVQEAATLDWGGVRVRLCCPGCDRKFLKDPAQALAKLGLEVVKVKGKSVVDLANPKCPGMGGQTKDKVFGVHAGVRVHYCCPPCDKKVAKDPAKGFAALGYKYIPPVVDLRNKTCPFTGKPVDGKTHADHDGVRVQLCCPGCIKKLERDPAMAFQKLGVDPARVKTQTK